MELLCFDVKIDAQQAKARGLVTDVFSDASFIRLLDRMKDFLPKIDMPLLPFSPISTMIATVSAHIKPRCSIFQNGFVGGVQLKSRCVFLKIGPYLLHRVANKC